MLYDGIWLQKILIYLLIAILSLVITYFVGYTSGKKDQEMFHQRQALLIQEQVNQSAIVVQHEMEKTDAKLEKASSVSEECNFVLNFDLTPCGVFK